MSKSFSRWRFGPYSLLGILLLALAANLASTHFLDGRTRKAPSARPPPPPVAPPPGVPRQHLPVVPLPKVAFPEALFSQLIRLPWVGVDCNPKALVRHECVPILFLANGSILRTMDMEVLSRKVQGTSEEKWDLRGTHEHSGVIATSNETLHFFELVEGNQLRLDGRFYRQLENPELKPPQEHAHVARPSELRVLAGFERLVATPWRKAHPFNADTQPELLTFHPDGRLEASYRQGSCVHQAHFKVREGQLSFSLQEDPCRQGARLGPRRYTSSRYPDWFAGDWLLLQDLYVPADRPTQPPQLFAGEAIAGPTVTGQFSTAPRPREPTELLLKLYIPPELEGWEPGVLFVRMRERTPGKARKQQFLFTKLLPSTLTGLHEYRAQVTPGFGGPVELELGLTLNHLAGVQPQRRISRVYTADF